MADLLAHTKELFIARAYDGFGVRQFNDDNHLTPGQRYLHNVLVPGLLVAIKLDEPGYVPGVESEATRNDSVRHYVWEVARDGQALYRADYTHPVIHMIYEPGQRGCFFDALVTAVRADAPEWVPNYPDIKSSVIALDLQF